MSDEGVELQEQINRAIDDIMPGFAIKYLVIVDASNSDGEREFWTFCSDDARSWDILGLLQYALQLQQAHIVKKMAEE